MPFWRRRPEEPPAEPDAAEPRRRRERPVEPSAEPGSSPSRRARARPSRARVRAADDRRPAGARAAAGPPTPLRPDRVPRRRAGPHARRGPREDPRQPSSPSFGAISAAPTARSGTRSRRRSSPATSARPWPSTSSSAPATPRPGWPEAAIRAELAACSSSATSTGSRARRSRAGRRSCSSSASTAPARPRRSASSPRATSGRGGRSSSPPRTRSAPPPSTSSGSGPIVPAFRSSPTPRAPTRARSCTTRSMRPWPAGPTSSSPTPPAVCTPSRTSWTS